MKFLIFCSLLFSCAFFATASQASVPIGGYSLWNRGSVRSIGLAGAVAADKHDSSAVVENQASMAAQPGVFAGTFDYGSPRDDNLKVSGTTSVSQTYMNFGASFLLWKRFALGIGGGQVSYSSRNRSGEGQSIDFSDNVFEVNFATAAKIIEGFYFGFATVGVSSKRELRSEFEKTQYYTGSLVQGETWKTGALLVPSSKVSLGVTYRHSASLAFSDAHESDALFSESLQPLVSQAAFSWTPFDSEKRLSAENSFSPLRISCQLDWISFTENSPSGELYYAPGVVFERREGYELNTRDKWIPRVGMEFVIFSFSSVYLIGRGGSYFEPAFLKTSQGRVHGTFGGVLKVGALVFQAGFDRAREYVNQNYGLGIDIEL